MAKRRHYYTREDLEGLGDNDANIETKTEILDRLSNRLRMSVPDLNLDEKHWLYNSILVNSEYFSAQESHWEERINDLLHPALRDYRFIYLFQNCQYANDINGYRLHRHLYGKEFTVRENEENVTFLNEVASEWTATLKLRNHSNQLLQRTCVEAESIIKEEMDAAQQIGMGYFLREAYRKQLTLLYKYIYLRGLEVFRDTNEHQFTISQNTIIFDHGSFVHLGRHIAPSVRPGIIGKSNFSQQFLLGNVHTILEETFDKIIESGKITDIPISKDSNTQLFFELNKVAYTIWIQSVTEDGEVRNRLSSIYPSEDLAEIAKRKCMTKIEIESGLYFFE
jgi:hypothetical protein